MPLEKEIFKSVCSTENGPGKMVFVIMTSLAFVISGTLEKIQESEMQEDDIALRVNQSYNKQGRRYCDPPNVTAFAIYYESSEEANVGDYDLLQNQVIVFKGVPGRPGMSLMCLSLFQNNVSVQDIEKQKGDIYYNFGFTASFFPACFLTAKFKPEKIFLYSVLLGVVLKVIFFEANLPLYINVSTSGFILGVVMFSFYDMTFQFVTTRRNTVISFAAVRQVGLAISELLIGLSEGKRYVLYITAVTALFWFIAWTRIQFQTSTKNIKFEESKNGIKGSELKTPWRKVLGSRPVWMTIAAIFGASCAMTSIFIGMRMSLKYVYLLQVEVLSAISGFLHAGFAVICGYFIDCLTEARIVSVTTSRRMIVYISHFIPSGFLFVLGFVGCGQTAPMIFYCLAVMTTGANYSGAFSSPLDLAPKYTEQILALCFTIGSLGSIFMNYLLHYILTNQVLVSWRFTFSMNSLILLLSAIFFMLRGSGSVQPWNDPEHNLTKERKNVDIEDGRDSVVISVPKLRTKSIYMVEKKILKVLHVQEPDKFTRVRAYSTSLPNERSSANSPNIYRPSNKKRASIS